MSDELENNIITSSEPNPSSPTDTRQLPISVDITVLHKENTDNAFEPQDVVVGQDKKAEQYLALLKLPAYSPVAMASEDVRQVFDDSTLESALDSIQLTCAYPICGHLELSPDKKLKVCRRKAGLNTKHETAGRCFIHDPEGSFIEPASPFARHLQHVPSLQSLYEDMQGSKEQFKSLNQELSMARTVLAAHLKKLNTAGKYSVRNQEVLNNIMMGLELIRKLAESAAKIQTIGSQQLTLDSVTAFLWKVQQIIEEEVLDPHCRLRILDRISTEVQFEAQ